MPISTSWAVPTRPSATPMTPRTQIWRKGSYIVTVWGLRICDVNWNPIVVYNSSGTIDLWTGWTLAR